MPSNDCCPRALRSDRDAAQRRVLPEAEFRRAGAARIERTLGLPQFEAMPRLAEALDGFWRGR